VIDKKPPPPCWPTTVGRAQAFSTLTWAHDDAAARPSRDVTTSLAKRLVFMLLMLAAG
jgi:hypothetical protein